MPKPTIVLIDDKADEITAVVALLEEHGIDARPTHPDEIEITDLEAADLVLVDWLLDEWSVPNSANLPIATRPRDGLALAEVLRSHVDADQHAGRPTAFALHSGALGRLSRDLPGEIVEYALARVHNLEWVFTKGPDERLSGRFVEFAEVVNKLPHPWPTEPAAGREALLELLALDATDGQSWDTVAECHPPIFELAANTNGLTVLRWLAQRILPYPCFLIDETYLTARLQLQPNSMRRQLDEESELVDALISARYAGALASFDGPRWWRSRVEDSLWEITDGGSASPKRLREAIAALAPTAEFLDTTNPVVCVDDGYRLREFADVNDAVRMSLDDWPPYALDPWVTIDRARAEEAIATRVLREDRDKLAL
jgi:CheY-like chemotaxis protein